MSLRLTEKQAKELGIKLPKREGEAKLKSSAKTTPTVTKPKEPSPLEETLLIQIRDQGLPLPEREYRFSPPRRWRFDFAYPDLMLAVECEGGVWSQGQHGHSNALRFIEDCEKYNAAVILGWRVLRFTERPIYSWQAVEVLAKAIHAFTP